MLLLSVPRARLLRRGLRLEFVTLGWNVVAVAVLGMAALAAGSPALAGFGLDSLIEIAALMVVIWQLRAVTGDRERIAVRLIGVSFVLLAAYLVVQIVYIVVTGGRPTGSPLGIGWTAATVAVMLTLAGGKIRTGRALGNPVLAAEGRVTLVDAYLAAAVLAGLVLNAGLGWWWADPAATVAVAGYAAREARLNLRD